MKYVYKIAKYRDVTIQMDTTYWGRNFGLMVIRDALRGNVLWHKYVTNETVAQYIEGIEWLKRNGFRIYGVMIDCMKGLLQALRPIRVQMCQFHQMLIVRRHLTQGPDLEAVQELLNLVTSSLKQIRRALSELSMSGMRSTRILSMNVSVTRESNVSYLRIFAVHI